MEAAHETATASPSDLSQALARLRSDLENVQRELDQALNVWRNALITEKKELQALFQQKQLAWSEQESEWHKERQAYEQKIQDLEAFFKTQVAVREQHALQALNELDDSWQRDKLLWDQNASKRLRELEQRDTLWQSENQKQEARIKELEERNADLQSQAQARPSESAETGIMEQERIENLVHTLEEEVSNLEAVVRPFIPKPRTPQRRKTDWL